MKKELSMGRIMIAVAGLCLLVTAPGCRSAHDWLFGPQGTMYQQQSEALVHDPYPAPDIAPEDPAARPRDFLQPLPEPVRNNIVPNTQIWTAR